MSEIETKNDCKKIWTCRLCGRDKFTRAGQPHKCSGGYRKNFKRAARLRGCDNCWTWRWRDEGDAVKDEGAAVEKVKKPVVHPEVTLVSLAEIFCSSAPGGQMFKAPTPPAAFDIWWEAKGSHMTSWKFKPSVEKEVKRIAKAAFNEALRQMNDI